MTPGFEETAWAWVDHLRGGGCTPWADFVASPPAAGGTPAGVLPGAAELELLRRLAARLEGRVPARFGRLADVVLSRSGPGRGLPNLPLSWPGAPPVRFGAPPADPGRIPLEELVRVGTGTLAELLLATPTPPAPVPPAPPRRLPWSRQLHLAAGAPLTTAGVRASFAAGGHAEGGRHPEVVLFVQPFDVHLAEIWSARVQSGSPVRWQTFVARCARRPQLPPSLRLDTIAAHWAGVVGPERVHLVVAPQDAAEARRTAGEAVGLRPGEAEAPYPRAPLDPAATDVLCRLNKVLRVRLDADAHDAVRARATGLLRHGGGPLALPAEHAAWAEQEADRLARALEAGGYAVHGDLGRVALRHRSGASPSAPRRRDVLDLVLDACLAVAVQDSQEQERA